MYKIVRDEKKYLVHKAYLKKLFLNGIEFEKGEDLLVTAINKKILPNTGEKNEYLDNIVKKMFTAAHKGEENNFIENYKKNGTLKCFKNEFNNSSKEKISELFSKDKRFHGRVPRIIDSIVKVYETLIKEQKDFSKEEIAQDLVTKFNIDSVSKMLQAGIPETQAVLLYYLYDHGKCLSIKDHPFQAETICLLNITSFKKNDLKGKQTADWIVNHLDTKEKIINKIKKEYLRLNIDENTTVDSIIAQLSNMKALKEVEKIEQAYKDTGFKFKDCTCTLKNVGEKASTNAYQSYILPADDERSVRLGQDTFCCQMLGDAGESAMMHGLINPKAGFWIIEDKHSKIIKAQAEVWEENEDTLVFDNIEYANDAELDHYKDILKEWLQLTDYKTIKMGAGYNTLSYNADFRICDPVNPTVTPYEIYVISHEEESEAPVFSSEEEAKNALDSGSVTYYDYVYCDSESNSVFLKENGRLEPYFGVEQENEETKEDIYEKINNIVARYHSNLLTSICNEISIDDTELDVTLEDEYEQDNPF